jgi:hypothetical protein
MTELESAVLEVTAFLEAEHVPYMVIGGFANLHWGRPRLTQDVDVTIQVPEGAWPAFIALAGEKFQMLSHDPVRFARETRVIPVATRSGVHIDLVLAGLPYEEEAIRRAIGIGLGDRQVRICTAEDLILHKLVSTRPRDLEDVQGVVTRQAGSLDRSYLDPRVKELALMVERPQIESFYRTCLTEAGI